MSRALSALLGEIAAGHRPTPAQARSVGRGAHLAALMETAAQLRDAGHGDVVSYSRKVFIALTHLCRDVCHYCTFARTPRADQPAYLPPEEVLALARRGAAAGCREALFTLGDKPELRFPQARQALAALGHATTLAYLKDMAGLVVRESGLFPHLNPGLMGAADLAALRPVSVSMGIMLETAAERLGQQGGPHFGSPDKAPAARLEAIRLAGEAAVPFTSGILIGLGETRQERVDALLHLRDLHQRYGHLQEIIIQNFRAKPQTRMASAPEPALDELLWTVAMARIVFGSAMNIQAPPNLNPGCLQQIVRAGINDWGGVSPVTPDFVNPEAPWPHLARLAEATRAAGKTLTERLPIYPTYALDGERWLDSSLRTAVLRAIDAEGFARVDAWAPGAAIPPPALELEPRPQANRSRDLDRILLRAQRGDDLPAGDIVRLFQARGEALADVCAAASDLGASIHGKRVTYVVNRNINYTNVCYFRCQFCAFSKGKLAENLRGAPYEIDLDEIRRRTAEAWARGASEVCLQGGIHPGYTGRTYLAICRAVKEAAPSIHVHAFSPLEVWHGARTLNLSIAAFLAQLGEAGLNTLPGTAAEILDDPVRRILCPDKISAQQWLSINEAAHRLGLKTTSTIMFGHVEGPASWARHLLRLRALQARTGGFTELVPLPFVPMEAPIYRKGRARSGPSFREAVLMHAVARLVLFPHLGNIQVSWVKMGPEGAKQGLRAGANDLGGTLMNESITRAAGASHGQELAPREMEALIRSIGREPAQRTTTYGPAPAARIEASFSAAPLAPIWEAPAAKWTGDRLALARPSGSDC